jgi:hypothetical protein
MPKLTKWGALAALVAVVGLLAAVAAQPRSSRNAVTATPTVTTVPPTATSQPIVTPIPQDTGRVFAAAMNITGAFEGSGYGTIATNDAGIINYGRLQFTLASGDLDILLQRYQAASTSETAEALSAYAARVAQHDATLAGDVHFIELLKAAADEPDMQRAQDQLARERYWNEIYETSILPRNIETPLGQALVFDTTIHHGLNHTFLIEVEDALGVPRHSAMPANGVTEQAFIRALAERRSSYLYTTAEQYGYPGLKTRADFWIDLIERGDWHLEGDESGEVTVKPGVTVQVRSP